MIDIILASYNGEKFIRQQMLSLMGQSYTDWRCIIHDDGSSDKTVSIIKEIAKLDSRFILKEDGIKLRNAAKNFMHTLSYSDAEYICFCDQDDVWLDSKLERLLTIIEQKNNSIPQVVFSNAYLWNSDKNFIYGRATLDFPQNIESLLFLNCGIQGASAIFNRKMKEEMLVPLNNIVMHDWYLTIIGCTFGEIDYIHENLMLYRQHGNNVTGNADGLMKSKLKKIFKRKNPLIDLQHLESLKSFYSIRENELNLNDKKNICKFIKSTERSFFYRLFMILFGNWSIYGSKQKLLFKFFIRPYIGGLK